MTEGEDDDGHAEFAAKRMERSVVEAGKRRFVGGGVRHLECREEGEELGLIGDEDVHVFEQRRFEVCAHGGGIEHGDRAVLAGQV